MLPDPDTLYPVTLPDGTPWPGTVFLRNALSHSNIEVGDYSYFSTFDPLPDPSGYATRLAPYLFDGAKDRLRIGKFCQIAHGTRFITHGANHAMDGASTFPFPIFNADTIGSYRDSFVQKRDTVVGHDCWLGDGCTLLPGARLGNGVIVGAGAVVGGDVPDYAVVVGNPGRVIKLRFEADVVERLLTLAWWDWPLDKINAHHEAIVGADIPTLLAL